MALYCKSIQELTVEDNDSTNGDALVDLIKVQKDLCRFTIRDWWGCLVNIVQALTAQVDTLVYVEIYGCHFYELVDDSRTFEGLTSCVNLETLKIEECYNITSEIMQPLATTVLPKLKTLYFSNFMFPDEDNSSPHLELTAMIQNMNSNLEQLRLNMDLDSYPEIIQTCAKNCPNLTYFKAKIQNYDEINQLLVLIENCRKLVTLEILSEKWDFENDREDGRLGRNDYGLPLLPLEFFPYMAQLTPSTLKYLEIDGWTCTPMELEIFLTSCKARLKKMSLMCFKNSKDYLE
ncbi:3584_t:CDS:1, partial [Acaulospora colombiana]